MSTAAREQEPEPEPFGPRPVVSSARAAAAALSGAEPSRLWALSGEEVAEALGQLEVVRATAERLQVAVLTEASQRGLGAEDGWGPIDWA